MPYTTSDTGNVAWSRPAWPILQVCYTHHSPKELVNMVRVRTQDSNFPGFNNKRHKCNITLQ